VIRQQVPWYSKAEQSKIVTIGDLERLRGVNNGKISGSANLLVTTLRVLANPVELKVDEAQIVLAARYVRTQAQNPVLGCSDAGDPNGSRLSPEYCSLEGKLGYLPRFQLDKIDREIVCPGAEGLIRLTLFCRPLHEVS
jgi:hypothetical protein